MIRAVLKDRRGDVVRDPMSFPDDAALQRYQASKAEEFARTGHKIVELPPPPLNDDDLALLEFLQKLASQSNGIIKNFVIDADMHRRWRNRTPTAADVELFRATMAKAAERYSELARKEFGI